MSALEQQLKRIVRDHPAVRLHPHSPSGPYVRAVMWTAGPGILGQAFREKDGTWVVRAAAPAAGEESTVVARPAGVDDVPAAITDVLVRLAAKLR